MKWRMFGELRPGCLPSELKPSGGSMKKENHICRSGWRPVHHISRSSDAQRTFPEGKKGNHQSNDLPAEKIEEIRELRRSGLLIREAAAVAGVTVYMVRKYTQDIITTEDKLQQTGQPGTLCRHKETCRHWRPLSGLGGGISACHYPIDRDELRPWPADQCPGFPGPKTGPNQTPMGIKRKE